MSALAAPPGLFFGVQNLVIPNGKFVQVGHDYHVHGDVNTQIDNTSTSPLSATPFDGHQADPSRKAQSAAATYVTGDQHIHGDYHVHYHGISIGDSDAVHIRKIVGPPRSHYHVYKGQDIVFCTQFSDIYTRHRFPVFPSLVDMTKYTRIIFEWIDKAMPGYRWWTSTPISPTTRRSYPKPFSFMSSKRLSTPYEVSGMPEFDYEEFKKDRERLYTLHCMHITEPDTAHEPLFTPRSALFSHLDSSGVK